MVLRLFSLGVLAAITSLITELMLFSFFPKQSIILLALAVPLIEELIKLGILWKGRILLPQVFSHNFLTVACAFGLGFAIPEGILAGSSGLMTDVTSFILTIGIHLISAFFLLSATLFLMKRKPLSAFSLFIFSFAIHALYNFFVFIR